MNPQSKLDALLESSGAVPLRTGKHAVYKLPNGQRFAHSKTPGDHRSVLNSISDLRRAANIGKPTPIPPPTKAKTIQESIPIPIQPEIERTRDGYIAIPVITAPEPEPDPTPPTREPSTPLAKYLDELIAAGIEEQAELMDRAGAIEQQVNFLRTIRERADDPMTPALLALLVPKPVAAVAQPQPAPPPPPLPPPTIEVTKSSVSKALARVGDEFTIGDLYPILINGATLDAANERRVKNLITMQLRYQMQNGANIEILKSGRSGQMSIWRKIDPAQIGTRVEIKLEKEPPQNADTDPQEN